MNDRELLESAARAAGYDTNYSVNAERLTFNPPVHSLWIRDERGMLKTAWNPLTDDGDAFRLAVKLDISLRQKFAMVQADYPWVDEEFNERKVLCEGVLDDYFAATRRAIVRAAAEIGKKVGAPQVAG